MSDGLYAEILTWNLRIPTKKSSRVIVVIGRAGPHTFYFAHHFPLQGVQNGKAKLKFNIFSNLKLEAVSHELKVLGILDQGFGQSLDALLLLG